MSDWQVGDLALCIRGGQGELSVGRVGGVWKRESDSVVAEGVTYIVRRVRFTDDGEPYLGLIEVEGPWMAYRFHKIRPHHPDAEDEETIRALNGQPVRETV